MAPKTVEFDKNDPMSWEGLGQTFPEFTTGGSAGYGVRRTPFFVTSTNKAQRIGTTAFLNPASSDYAQVIGALQGARVNGISRVGTFDRVQGVDGLDGLLDDIKAKAKSAVAATKEWKDGYVEGWKVIGRSYDKATEGKSGAWEKAKAAANAATKYATSADGFVSDLAEGTGIGTKTAEELASVISDAQKQNDLLYIKLQSTKKDPKFKPGPKFAEIEALQQKDWAQITAYAYACYAVPGIAFRLRDKGVRKPDIAKPEVLKAVQGSTLAKQVYEQVKKGNGTGALAGVGALPALGAGAIVAIVIAASAAIIAACTMISSACKTASKWLDDNRRAKLQEDVKAGKLPASALSDFEKTKQTEAEQAKAEADSSILGNITKNLPYIVGGVVILALLPTIVSLAKGGASAIQARQTPAPVQGLARYRRGHYR